MKLLLFLAAQPSTTENLIYYIAAGILTVAVLIGIAMMSKVETSVKGNLLGAISMLLAIVLTLWYFNIFTVIELWIAMLVGLAIGIINLHSPKRM